MASAALLSGCSRNPATGRLQAFLISDQEEIALGKENDAEIQHKIGLYEESEALQALVGRVGAELAAKSERPGLPWTFRVLDDPTVNAFALPGGYVYVTRGLLAHLNSDDELAAVLGHEIGHVTARHSAVHLRKSSVARASVGLFRVVDPNLRHIGGIAAQTAGLALLRYSRVDEHEADNLGLRYVQRAGYDPTAIPEVFGVLAQVASTGGKVPVWLSTHPEPEQRRELMARRVGARGRDITEADYLKAVEGIVFGTDPRDGFVLGQRFVQPRTGFRIDLPEAWKIAHDRSGVFAISPKEDGVFLLSATEFSSLKLAAEALLTGSEIAAGDIKSGSVDGFESLTAAFSVPGNEGGMVGVISLVEFKGTVLVMAALASYASWQALGSGISKTLASFRRVRQAALLNVEPGRLRLATTAAATTVKQLAALGRAPVDAETLARLNHVTPDEPLPAGRVLKLVRGFVPPKAG